jgi:SAM-dependent methyltransferase
MVPGNLDTLQRAWSDLARKDAMWAVLTGPLGATRSWNQDAFFRTGVEEIAFVLDHVALLGVGLRPGRALDFGCGPGRLTQAMAARFERVDGVDIAPGMIERANALNKAGERCVYHLNGAADLRLFGDATFDFVYSNITLQHMEPRLSRSYIAEFARVTRPGGVIVFQLPSEPVAVDRPRTRQAAALSTADCRAIITAPRALRCAPGAVLPLRIMIRNAGREVWCASDRSDDGRYAVRLGNHWRNRFGFMRQFDDLRTGLAFDVAPGESVEVGINPVAPSKPGVHILEFDLVQEYVRWFAEAGSRRTRMRVTVDPSLPSGEVQGLPPLIEMHGIARPEVETLIARLGCMLVAAYPDDAPGPGWTSFRYVVQKPAAGPR